MTVEEIKREIRAYERTVAAAQAKLWRLHVQLREAESERATAG